MNIRPEEPGGHEGVHAASFPSAAEERLVGLLREAGSLCVSLAAVEEGEIVGHVAFSPVTVTGATDGLGMAPVSVVPVFRRRGIAEKLIQAGLEVSERLEFGFVDGAS